MAESNLNRLKCEEELIKADTTIYMLKLANKTLEKNILNDSIIKGVLKDKNRKYSEIIESNNKKIKRLERVRNSIIPMVIIQTILIICLL